MNEPVLSSNNEDDNMDDVEYEMYSEVEDSDYETNPRQWSSHNWIGIHFYKLMYYNIFFYSPNIDYSKLESPAPKY
ncbi:hypothetical protein J6590_000287 [Homalodisca vitripennis]|nr:hypothetical protein J6590_000287 [Homalodisca vitripennis]